MAKRGPKTEKGKQRSSLNSLKHGLRSRPGIRKCFPKCPAFDACEARAVGEECVREREEIQTFTNKLLELAADPRDPVARAFVEGLAREYVMWRRGLEFLSSVQDGDLRDYVYVLELLTATERRLRRGLAEYKRYFAN